MYISMSGSRPGAIRGAMIALSLTLALAGPAQADLTVSQSNGTVVARATETSTRIATKKQGFGSGFLALIAGPRKSGPAQAAPAFDEAWLAVQPKASGDEQFECLATALYFEARGESLQGQAAVAEVILNRTEAGDFPRTVCGVVNQKGNGGCQFSYTCDGNSDRIHEAEAWDRARKIARAMLDGAPRALTDGATYFHTPAVRPGWSRRFERTAQIGRHIFYRAPIQTAMN